MEDSSSLVLALNFLEFVWPQSWVAPLGQYGEAEKEGESDDSATLYHVWFDAKGECELLPADKTRVLSTQPVKEQKTNE
jgi:hypothetical protein